MCVAAVRFVQVLSKILNPFVWVDLFEMRVRLETLCRIFAPTKIMQNPGCAPTGIVTIVKRKKEVFHYQNLKLYNSRLECFIYNFLR